MSGFSSNVARAWLSSAKSGLHSALRALGRFSVTSPTPGAGLEVRMYSYCVVLEDIRRMRRSRLEEEEAEEVGDGMETAERNAVGLCTSRRSDMLYTVPVRAPLDM